MFNSFNGLQVICSPHALEETDERLFRENKYRSKRLHKKLCKRHGGEFKKVPAIFQMGDKILAHPTHYQRIKNDLM
jgi:hypothetical protein